MKHTITICMGSSCFARGNKRNMKIIEEYLARYKIDCVGRCRSGPNLSIDGEAFEQVDSETLIDLLDSKLRKDAP